MMRYEATHSYEAEVISTDSIHIQNPQTANFT